MNMSPDDELEDLVKRILVLNYRLKSQLEALGQQNPTSRRERESSKDTPPTLESLLKIVKREVEKPPAYLSSLNVHYDGKGRWTSTEPPMSENEEWISVPSVKRQVDVDVCADCKYKEALEEVLNIFSVCGFVRRFESERLDSPDVSKGPSDVQRTPGDFRIKFKGKDGKEREFYY